MANGENHAKEILIQESLGYATKLENGSAGDMQIMCRALSKNIRMTAAMFENNFRTAEDCDKFRKEFKDKAPKKAPMKLKIGPVAFEGFVSQTVLMALPSIITCMVAIFALAKWQKWF